MFLKRLPGRGKCKEQFNSSNDHLIESLQPSIISSNCSSNQFRGKKNSEGAEYF